MSTGGEEQVRGSHQTVIEFSLRCADDVTGLLRYGHFFLCHTVAALTFDLDLILK